MTFLVLTSIKSQRHFETVEEKLSLIKHICYKQRNAAIHSAAALRNSKLSKATPAKSKGAVLKSYSVCHNSFWIGKGFGFYLMFLKEISNIKPPE